MWRITHMAKKNVLGQALDELKEHVEWDETKEEIKDDLNGDLLCKVIGWTIIIVVVINVFVI